MLTGDGAAPVAIATQVRARFRPQSLKEGSQRCMKIESEESVAFHGDGALPQQFVFDAVYGEDSSQATLFEDLKISVDSVLEGINGTILAYGQTGSGKTHTLIGDLQDQKQQGIVPRAILHLGLGIKNIIAASPGTTFKVLLSVVEIYCEQIRDLLEGWGAATPNGGASEKNLQVRHDPARGNYIEGAMEISVEDEAQLSKIMQHGLSLRTIAATAMNQESSRSHCIVTVRVEHASPSGEGARSAKLCMVDLAGSERQSKTGASGATLAEGSQINKSLSCLANVIYALTESANKDIGNGTQPQPPRYVPFRDSKLTRVLQDSLGGNARTALIICCSPSSDNSQETLSSLRFGSRAKGMSCTIRVNQQQCSPEQLQEQLSAARDQIADLTKLAKEFAVYEPFNPLLLKYWSAESVAEDKGTNSTCMQAHVSHVYKAACPSSSAKLVVQGLGGTSFYRARDAGSYSPPAMRQLIDMECWQASAVRQPQPAMRPSSS
eukprot:gene19464-26125_t